MKPKITVLLTVYNGEKYLKECMDSVLNQSFKEFEFLVIDDFSCDSSLEIIRGYKDDRVRIIENKENIGQIKSLNIGLDCARGEYIARIDQDDIMLKTRLKSQLDFLEKKQNAAVAGSWAEVIDEAGRVIMRSEFPVRNEEIIANALFAGYFMMHPSVFFRKKAVIDAGKYDETVLFAEDYDLWTRLLLKRHKFANLPEILTRFRRHKDSSSRKFAQKQTDNVYASVRNFIRNITANSRVQDSDELSNALIKIGLIESLLPGERFIAVLNGLLYNSARHFNFSNKEKFFFKKVFFNKLLNFAYAFRRTNKALSRQLYSYCVKNILFILEKPKLYLYPF